MSGLVTNYTTYMIKSGGRKLNTWLCLLVKNSPPGHTAYTEHTDQYMAEYWSPPLLVARGGPQKQHVVKSSRASSRNDSSALYQEHCSTTWFIESQSGQPGTGWPESASSRPDTTSVGETSCRLVSSCSNVSSPSWSAPLSPSPGASSAR